MSRLLAAADIGSNTAHLLIANLSPSGFKKLVNESEWLSLGECVSREGRIPPAKKKELLATLGRFKAILAEYGVQEFCTFATEAMRRAENCAQVVAEIHDTLGVEIEIISPEREAELSYLSSEMDCPGEEPFILIEAGGGSVQVAFCDHGSIQKVVSMPIGSGALRARSGLDQPANSYALAEAVQIISRECKAIEGIGEPQRVVACGGVSRGVWRALHADGDQVLFIEELDFLIWDTQRLSTPTIVDRYGVKVNRARTLLAGSLVLRHILELFLQREFQVSKYGVREGAILEMAGRSEESWLSN